ncbi:MAG: 2-dehydropantoate 2-reductase [Deltaproteobacteria bacterium]|nr:2-dehydropantoate 2-reductase [Deltaproteobacteria bacterium]
MKIAVIGPGAMGLLFTAKLAEAGYNATLVDHRADRAAALARDGINVKGLSDIGPVHVPVITRAGQMDQANLVLICVKAYDTPLAAATAKDLVAPDGWVLTLQNGVGNVERLAEVIPAAKILAGVTSHGATVLAPGVVRHAGQGDTTIGPAIPSNGHNGDRARHESMHRVAEVLTAAGFTTAVSPNVQDLIWSKLVVNVGINALTAITGLCNGELLSHTSLDEVLNRAVAEAVEVGQAKGITFIHPVPVAKVREVAANTASNVSSMLQDMLKQRPTEIDYINGAITTEGGKLGIPTPVNMVLAGIVKGLEASHRHRVAPMVH